MSENINYAPKVSPSELAVKTKEFANKIIAFFRHARYRSRRYYSNYKSANKIITMNMIKKIIGKLLKFIKLVINDDPIMAMKSFIFEVANVESMNEFIQHHRRQPTVTIIFANYYNYLTTLRFDYKNIIEDKIASRYGMTHDYLRSGGGENNYADLYDIYKFDIITGELIKPEERGPSLLPMASYISGWYFNVKCYPEAKEKLTELAKWTLQYLIYIVYMLYIKDDKSSDSQKNDVDKNDVVENDVVENDVVEKDKVAQCIKLLLGIVDNAKPVKVREDEHENLKLVRSFNVFANIGYTALEHYVRMLKYNW